jgi:hypothetical protein
MLHPAPPAWAHFLPGYGGFRVLTDAILTPSFSQTGPLLTALAWLAAATVAAALLFRHNMHTSRGASPRSRPWRPRPAQAEGGLGKPQTAR